jgi:hypothetical protein
MRHVKKTGRPPLLDEREIASQLDAVASIRRGLAQARKGVGRPADDVFDDLVSCPVNSRYTYRLSS